MSSRVSSRARAMESSEKDAPTTATTGWSGSELFDFLWHLLPPLLLLLLLTLALAMLTLPLPMLTLPLPVTTEPMPFVKSMDARRAVLTSEQESWMK